MNTGFSDPIAPRKGKEKKSPWDYTCPKYDERTSCYVNAGSHYGLGHKNPIGSMEKAKSRVPTLPYGRVDTLKVSEIPLKNKEPEFID